MRRILFFGLVFVASLVATTGFLQARAQSDLDEGQRLAEQGDVQGAMAAFEEAVQANPGDPEAHARLGGMQLVNQRYPDAVRSFQQAISLGEDSGRSFLGMGMAYLHMGQYGPARAALLEARVLASSSADDIDQILAWLDQQEGKSEAPKATP